MRNFLGFGALIVFALCGCNQDTGGGAGRDTQFTVSGPMTATDVVQGSEATAEITLDPGKKFNQTVKLKAEALDSALSKARLSESSIKLDGTSKKTVTVTVSAPADAAPGS